MMFNDVTALTIPEGEVTKIESNGVTLWEKKHGYGKWLQFTNPVTLYTSNGTPIIVTYSSDSAFFDDAYVCIAPSASSGEPTIHLATRNINASYTEIIVYKNGEYWWQFAGNTHSYGYPYLGFYIRGNASWSNPTYNTCYYDNLNTALSEFFNN